MAPGILTQLFLLFSCLAPFLFWLFAIGDAFQAWRVESSRALVTSFSFRVGAR